MSSLFHYTFGAPPRPDYVYGPHGIGVRTDLVEAIVEAWDGSVPTGAPGLLRDACEGQRTVEDVARIAAVAVAARLVGTSPT
ncbi:hypothetical protein B4N89_27970 [Embleya scabrispora]|uniref:Uncharacterized protein n=1 Tax=Embleya scabrispora TaxID=159449 RepID=A0A1T3P5A8_9ACTN|nr:hypothetical protein [Embleya scabrispora]OPC84256.1 hypothetical protein B4N89_27970 [Embleya scabrispora]